MVSSHSNRTMTAKAKASRLDEIRQRFQTRPLHEKEQKLVAMYQRQQQQALEKMAKTFRRQGSDSIAKRSSLDETEARAPRQRAVIGGRHNVLEPLRKENESNLPRPSRPNDRYAPTPPTRPGLARPHLFLAKHGGKLPAVGRRSNSVSHLQVTTPTHGSDSVSVALARKEREIRLQLKKRETDLEMIRKELLDSDLVRERGETTNNGEGGEMIGDLLPCSVCGRKFVADRLEKHVAICSKTSRRKRKVFSSATMRRRGTEMEQYGRRKGEGENRGVVSRKPGKGNWRRQHEEFIAAIQSAKKAQEHVRKGGKLSDLPPPPPLENPDYVPCPYCKRRFNPSTAERHIPKCKDIKHRPAPPKSKRK